MAVGYDVGLIKDLRAQKAKDELTFVDAQGQNQLAVGNQQTERQNSVNATNIQTQQMGNDTQLAVNKGTQEGLNFRAAPGMTEQSQKNAIDLKYGDRKAAAVTGDMENTAALNLKYGDKTKQTALDSATAMNEDLLASVTKTKSDKRIADLNTGGSVFVQNEASSRTANATTKAQQVKNTLADSYNPDTASLRETSLFSDKAETAMGRSRSFLTDLGEGLLKSRGLMADRRQRELRTGYAKP